MIKGKMVGLRAVEREDLSLMRDWRNIPEFRRNFREHRELNMVMQEKWFERIVVGSPNDFMFMIERTSDHLPIGVCGLVYVNWVIRSADISLYIGHEHKYIDNDGMAEEATRLLIGYGFNVLNMHKVWTELYEFDERKIAFFTNRMGFQRDAILRDNCFEDGRYWNSYILSLIRPTGNDGK
jgi:RimJ/RimL family protein N-acetyltransferase